MMPFVITLAIAYNWVKSYWQQEEVVFDEKKPDTRWDESAATVLEKIEMGSSVSDEDLEAAVKTLTTPNALHDDFRMADGTKVRISINFPIQHNTSNSLLMYAVHHCNPRACHYLLEHGADPLLRNNRGATAMQYTAKLGRIDMAQMMYDTLKTEAERDRLINSKNQRGWTPLHAAAQNNRKEFLEWLIHHKADVNSAMPDSNWSVLHIAALQNNADVEDTLERAGADPDLKARNRNLCGDRALNPRQVNIRIRQRLQQEDIRGPVDEIVQPVLRKAKPLRALVVTTCFVDFHDGQEDSIRKGAEKDAEILRATFKRHVECDVYPKNLKGNLTKADFAIIVRKVQHMMESDRHELLFWFVSSHGGKDCKGDFFLDSRGEKIFLYPDLIHKFSVDQCPAMARKKSIFFPNCCRLAANSPPSALPYEQGMFGVVQTQAPRATASKFAVARVTMDEAPSARSVAYGSLPIRAFRAALQELAKQVRGDGDLAAVEVRRLFQRAGELMRRVPVSYDDGVDEADFVKENYGGDPVDNSTIHHQCLGLEDHLLEGDVYLKIKSDMARISTRVVVNEASHSTSNAS